MDLQTLLETVIAGGLGGSLIYVVLANWPWFVGLQPDVKRIIAFAANALIAIVALLVAIGMGYTPPPVGATAWVELVANTILRIGATAFAVSQAWHLRELRQ